LRRGETTLSGKKRKKMGVFARNGAYYIRYRVPGTNKKKWEKVGQNKRQAELLLAERKVAGAKGLLRPVTAKPMTTHELFTRYKEHVLATRAPSSLRGLLWILSKLYALPDIRAAQLTIDTVHKWLYAMREGPRGLQPGTLANIATELCRAYSLAYREWGLLPVNPLAGFKLPWPVKNERTRFLTAEQIPQVLAALPWPWSGMARVAVFSGLRKAEVLALKWEDVNFAHGYLQVRHGKGDKFRMVPLVASLAAWLQTLPRLSPWVFTSPKTRGRYQTGNMPPWKETLETVGITDFHFHDLRHTTATLLRINGVSLQTIGEILGHSNLRFTARYAHLPQAYRQQAMEDLAQAITKSEIQLPPSYPQDRDTL
jgi:integrase